MDQGPRRNHRRRPARAPSVKFAPLVVVPPIEIDRLSLTELHAIVIRLFDALSDLKRMVTEQREEIARLKVLKGRPDIKPRAWTMRRRRSHRDTPTSRTYRRSAAL